ncbi:MAG TPA: YdcF family protein [Candidatus Nanoarchaeia archaeon]|nr:YdcF family protein [Candidatus Nanoarchaeia archaeon]
MKCIGVLLPAGILSSGDLPKKALQRADRAIALWQKKRFCNLIVGGGLRSRGRSGITEAQALAQYLSSQGLRKKDMLLEMRSKDTMGNALWAKELIQTRMTKKMKQVIVITSRYHCRRALMIFQKVLGPDWTIHMETVRYHPGLVERVQEWTYFWGERLLLLFLLRMSNPNRMLRFLIPRYW